MVGVYKPIETENCNTEYGISGNLGFNTYLISNATAAFGLKDQNDRYYDAEIIHNISLATLNDEFAIRYDSHL
ncbi:hypothetical protein GCM10008934_03590 [Virgibacillus salarius]